MANGTLLVDCFILFGAEPSLLEFALDSNSNDTFLNGFTPQEKPFKIPQMRFLVQNTKLRAEQAIL
jgi:hypothetical protein